MKGRSWIKDRQISVGIAMVGISAMARSLLPAQGYVSPFGWRAALVAGRPWKDLTIWPTVFARVW